MTTSSLTMTTPLITGVKDRTIATAVAIIAAVALPQLLHALGAATGAGPGIAAALLPMHIPVILVALLAGPTVGVIAGLASPLIAFAISGMPIAAVLPFMMLELAAYGLVAGLLVRVKMPVILKVIAVQIAGRLVRLAAVGFTLAFFNAQTPSLVSVWDATVAGLPGIILAWDRHTAHRLASEEARPRQVTTVDLVSDVVRAKTLLASGEYTCVLVKGDSVLTSAARGIAPMVGFITDGVDLRGYCVADKVVGKAAALLFVKAEVAEVYAPLASHAALDVLANAGIPAQLDTIVAQIMRADGAGPCPMEQAVADTDDPDTAYTLLRAALAKMRAAAPNPPSS